MRPALTLTFLLAFAEPIAAQQVAYVGSQTCTGCHTDSYDDWKGSHHALAWTEATPDNVVANFDGTEFSHDGMTARFSIADDGGYQVDLTEKDGSQRDYKVHSVVGVEPLQQYLLETEPGKLQSFDVVWDTEKETWFHLYPDQDLPPSDGLHWTGPYKNWNARCAECHATGFEKNYNAAIQGYSSTQVEIGVGCEACHGPGSAHVDWAEKVKTTQVAPPQNYGFSVDFSDPAQAINQCATCHSRRSPHEDGNPVPGTPYHDAYSLSLLRPNLYFADGQILDEVYVYGSFLQSRMYAKGVTCLNCHAPHKTERVAEGNAVCTQCHNPAGTPKFPSLPLAEYDGPVHHFHEPKSQASECKSCHMTERVYMGNDWRADHAFRIPRPDLAETTGAPDACTTCHRDQDPQWAAKEIAARFPDSTRRGPHFGETLARGRSDPVSAAGDLSALASDRDQPGIVRATALWLLEQSNSSSVAEDHADLLQDKDPLVRAAAVGLQRLAPPEERAERLSAAFSDPSRDVRMIAARTMLDALSAPMPKKAAADLREALREWRLSLSTRLDFPETHIQIAGLALTMRDMRSASSAFQEVVRMDPQRIEAWMMLVRIAAATQGPRAAMAVLDKALAANPNDPALLGAQSELSGNALPSDSLLPPD